jgi:phospholipid transport system substrate-binding protein
MLLRNLLISSVLLWALTLAGGAAAGPSSAGTDDPLGFVQQQYRRIEQLLRAPSSGARDAQVQEALGAFVDYDELTRRAFGEPCPATEPGCEDLWNGYADAQRAELRQLLEQMVRKTYQRNLMKTLDYDVGYRGARDAGGEARVMTEAKSRLKPREPAVRVDYVVRQTQAGLKVVDIVTEGSSLTKNYYDQFRKKMHNPNEGYPNIVQKLRDKIAKME